MEKIITKSEKETITLGKKIAYNLYGGEIILLYGELGAGKTALVKGIANGLGIKEKITSPTFTLMKIYPTKPIDRLKKKISLIHIDCYRINSAKEIEDIGAQEYFGKENTVVVVEWAKKIEKLIKKMFPGLQPKITRVFITIKNQNTRIFSIS